MIYTSFNPKFRWLLTQATFEKLVPTYVWEYDENDYIELLPIPDGQSSAIDYVLSFFPDGDPGRDAEWLKHYLVYDCEVKLREDDISEAGDDGLYWLVPKK